MSSWIQGENGNLDTKNIRKQKSRQKYPIFARWSCNFALWFEVCEIPILWTEEFAPCFPSCEIVPQLDAVFFRRPYLPHFSSKSYMVWIVGFSTFWALKWYIECRKWTSGSAPKVQWKTAVVSPVFITRFSSSPLFSPCILWTTKAKDYETPKLGFFINLSFPKALPWTIYSSPSFINCFGEHKAIKKHQNLTQLLEIWLQGSLTC